MFYTFSVYIEYKTYNITTIQTSNLKHVSRLVNNLFRVFWRNCDSSRPPSSVCSSGEVRRAAGGCERCEERLGRAPVPIHEGHSLSVHLGELRWVGGDNVYRRRDVERAPQVLVILLVTRLSLFTVCLSVCRFLLDTYHTPAQTLNCCLK